MSNENTRKKYTAGGLLFVGCMFVGMGLGFFFGHLLTGLLTGMGAGFVAFGIIMLLSKD
jgi:hypothetical protein